MGIGGLGEVSGSVKAGERVSGSTAHPGDYLAKCEWLQACTGDVPSSCSNTKYFLKGVIYTWIH